MATYWMTFRIAERHVDGRDADDRRELLYETIRQLTNQKWWKEPTSFVLFRSDYGIDQIVGAIKPVISEVHDLVLMRDLDAKTARVVGAVDDTDLFDLMPYVQQG